MHASGNSSAQTTCAPTRPPAQFDIEFGLENGTTYNAYLIFGEKTALVETSHDKFRGPFLEALQVLPKYPHSILEHVI